MKLTWSHLLPVLLLIAAVSLETAASKDVERESNRGRYGIFRKYRRSVSNNVDDNNVDDEPSGRVVTADFLNRIKGQSSGSCPPSNTATYTEPVTYQETIYVPSGSGTTYIELNNTRALNDFDDDDESDYEFDRNVYNRDDDDDDDSDYDNSNYLVSVRNGQRPMRQFDSNNDLSSSLDTDVDANSVANASRQNESDYVRRRRMRRRAAARRRRQRRRRQQMRRRRQGVRGNRRRRITRRRGPNVRGPNARRRPNARRPNNRGNRNGARRPLIPGLNGFINI